MKVFFVITLLILSANTHADLAQHFEAKCKTEENNLLMGPIGHCQIVLAPFPGHRKGLCTGLYMGTLPCTITFVSNKSGSMLNLSCGANPMNLIINQDLSAEAIAFTVATMIKKSDGQDLIKLDKKEYFNISSSILDVTLSEANINNLKLVTGSISISLNDKPVALTNVNCQ